MRRVGNPLAWVLMLLLGAAVRGADGPPRVVAAWAAGPLEARVALDRAADPAMAAGLVGSRIVFGDGVKAGDRFVERKAGDPPPDGPGSEARGALRVAAARLVDGGRTIVLATDPHSRDASYAMTLAGNGLAYNLRGVEAAWDSGKDDARPEWAGWWPSLDSAEVAARLGGWPGFEAARSRLATPGRLVLKTLAAMPKGKVAVKVRASAPFEVGLGNESARSSPDGGGHVAAASAEVEGDGIDLTLTVALDGKAPFALSATYRGPTDGADRPIAASQCTLPWAPPTPPGLSPSPVPPAMLTGGDPARGAAVFKGDQAKCATCHKVRGEGGEVGPDLTDLVHRDRAWAYRNINEPSASIQPDYVPYTVLLKDGRVLAGIVRAEGADAIRVVDTAAKATVIPKADVEELKPSATSIMPVGLLGPVGEEGTRDLLAYLAGK